METQGKDKTVRGSIQKVQYPERQNRNNAEE